MILLGRNKRNRLDKNNIEMGKGWVWDRYNTYIAASLLSLQLKIRCKYFA